MTGAPKWVQRYVGLPWSDGGRSFEGVDCEGLCRLVLRHEAGNPPLPDYGVLYSDGVTEVVRAITQRTAAKPFIAVARDDLRAFDIVVMTARTRVDGRPRTIPCHLGIMVDPDRILHIEELTDSVVVPLTRVSPVGFIRHEALA